MKKIKLLSAVMVLMLTALSLTGCVTFDNFKAAFIDKPQDKQAIIQIGVFEPITGADSVEAEAEIRGIQLANTVHPNVDGKAVQLVFADNKSDIDAAETAVQTLIVKQPAVILGSYHSVYSLAAADAIEDANIPAIAITNTNPLVTKNHHHYFRVCYVDSYQGDILADYVLKQKEENYAGVLIPSNDEAAQAMASEFMNRIKETTGNENAIRVYEEYKAGSTDFTEQLEIIKNSGIKSILLPGDVADCISIINQAAEMGLSTQFLGSTEWNEKSFAKALNDKVRSDSLGFVSFFASEGQVVQQAESVSEERQKFLDAYTEMYGEDSVPSDAVALGYDAYLVAVDAIGQAHSTDGEEIANVLRDPKYSFNGASGYINFSSIGDPIKTAYINTWQYGEPTTIYTYEPVR